MLLTQQLHTKKIKKLKQNWNFGPNISSCKTVKYVANYFADYLKLKVISKNIINKKFQPETSILRLSNYKSKKFIKWTPIWTLNKSLKKIIEWNYQIKSKKYLDVCQQQIKEFLNS